MAELTPPEPQSAVDYDDRTTTAVKSVLIEIGQILGSFKGKFAVVGGAVPWLLLNNEVMPHVGSLDVDLSLDAEALGDGEYVTLIDALRGHGYEQREELRRFQLVRKVPAKDGGAPIDIIVDFLMPRDAEIVKNNPPLLNNFAVQRALKHAKQFIHVLHIKAYSIVPDEYDEIALFPSVHPISISSWGWVRVNLIALERRLISTSLSIERSP